MENNIIMRPHPKNTLIKETADRAFQETGIKLIFHFLMHPESVNLSYRNIQEKTNISLGTKKCLGRIDGKPIYSKN